MTKYGSQIVKYKKQITLETIYKLILIISKDLILTL